MNLWTFLDVIKLKLLHNPGNIGASTARPRQTVELTKGI